MGQPARFLELRLAGCCYKDLYQGGDLVPGHIGGGKFGCGKFGGGSQKRH